MNNTIFKFAGYPLVERGAIETSVQPEGWRALFRGRGGIRAGWRLLLYIIGFALVSALLQMIVNRIPRFAEILRDLREHGTLSPVGIMIIATAGIVALVIPALIMARVEHRPWGAYGMPLQGAFGRLLWQGVIAGLVFESLIIASIAAAGGFSIGALTLSGAGLLKYAGLWVIGFLLIGIQEEYRFRGYVQFTLASGIGFWPAAFVLSLLSGLANRGPGATWIGVAEGMLFGLFACLTLQRTGTLWFAIGFRAAMDFAETFIYGVPDSGWLPSRNLLHSTLHGSKLITGGAPGPQESAVTFVMFLLAALFFAWLRPSREVTQKGRSGQ